MRVPMLLITLVAALALVAGCSNQDADQTASANDGGSSQAAPANSFTGTVAETMDSGGYTYVRLENGGKSIWAAGNQTAVNVGDELTVSTAMPMQGFHSDTLDRTFDVVYFVGGFEPTGEHAHDGGASDPHAGMDMGGMASKGQHGATPAPKVNAGSIEKAEGGHTIGELFAAKTALAGKSTTVRGRVVKFNGGIMGRNWVHLQDGTGEASAKTHDLLVTTNESCKVGDVISATGTVVVNKDFGSGYSYDLLLEEASVEVEESAPAGTR